MAKKSMRGAEPRKIWSRNLAPLVTAARDGASRAAETASKERARAARRESHWWRRRWLVVTAAGLAVAGATGGVYRAITKRQEAESGPEPAGTGEKPAGGTPTEAIRSTVETGREKVTEAARTMMHKIRRDEPDGGPETKAPASATGQPGKPAGTTADELRNQTDASKR